jgi:hypothetical protein
MYALKSATEFHHGGAPGADTLAHRFVATCRGIQRHCHPCPGVVRESFDDGQVWHEVLPPLRRNMNIALVCDILIAAPLSNHEEQRSGTWSTVRYGRAHDKPIIMLSRGV